MVMKNIDAIKKRLPELLHIIMFYNNGTVFQTTFTHQVNIPKLGENISNIINNLKNLLQICNKDECITVNKEKYKKIIFETQELIIVVLQLGEDSNIALFFKGGSMNQINLEKIHLYLIKLEELIDMQIEEIAELKDSWN